VGETEDDGSEKRERRGGWLTCLREIKKRGEGKRRKADVAIGTMSDG